MKIDTIIKSVFALAALLASGTYAYNSFLDTAEVAHADGGVDTREGFVVTPLGFNRQGGIVAVTQYSENPFDEGQMRQTMTVYEIVKQGTDGEAEMYLVGSRCLAYDSGPDLIKFEERKGEAPGDLREQIEKASKGKRR